MYVAYCDVGGVRLWLLRRHCLDFRAMARLTRRFLRHPSPRLCLWPSGSPSGGQRTFFSLSFEHHFLISSRPRDRQSPFTATSNTTFRSVFNGKMSSGAALRSILGPDRRENDDDVPKFVVRARADANDPLENPETFAKARRANPALRQIPMTCVPIKGEAGPTMNDINGMRASCSSNDRELTDADNNCNTENPATRVVLTR